MAELVWAPGEEAKAIQGIKDVRNDATGLEWAYVTYAGTSGAASSQLKFGGSGQGGVTALKEHLPENNIVFALVRVTDKIDLSVTVKFVWINWIGEKTPRMMQSKLSVQLGAIKQFFQPFSTDMTVQKQEEITHETVMERVLAYSVSGNKVIDDNTGGAAYRAVAATAGTAKVSAATSKMADGPVTFADGLRQEISVIRDDNSGINWVLIGYADPSKPDLVFMAKGNGGVAEMATHLRADNVAYGLVRKIERIDDTDAVKFCYIRWLGKDIPFMQRAKLGTHTGDIAEFFHPYHTSLDAPDITEVTDEYVMKLIQTASGTYKHVLDDDAAARIHSRPAAQPKPAAQSAPAQPKPAVQRAPVQPRAVPAPVNDDTIIVGPGIREAIQSVRSDTNLIDWALATYDHSNGKSQSKTLALVGTGEGGLAELKSKLADNMVGYALYRTTERVDDSETVKFVFIDWRGPQIHRMQRAILGTHSGAVRELFSPYHVDVLDVSKQDEVTEEIIAAKIKKAAGTANYVL